MNDPKDQKGGAMRISNSVLAAVREVGRTMLATGERYALLGERGHSTMAVATDRALLGTVIAAVVVDGTTLFMGLPSDPTPSS